MSEVPLCTAQHHTHSNHRSYSHTHQHTLMHQIGDILFILSLACKQNRYCCCRCCCYLFYLFSAVRCVAVQIFIIFSHLSFFSILLITLELPSIFHCERTKTKSHWEARLLLAFVAVIFFDKSVLYTRARWNYNVYNISVPNPIVLPSSLRLCSCTYSLLCYNLLVRSFLLLPLLLVPFAYTLFSIHTHSLARRFIVISLYAIIIIVINLDLFFTFFLSFCLFGSLSFR